MNKRKFQKLKSIAFVVWLFPKLSETFILNQIVQLKKLGYQILIFAVKNPQKELAKEDYEFEHVAHEDVKKYHLMNLTRYGSPKKLSSLLKQGIKKKKIDIVYFQFPDLTSEILKYGELECPTISVFHDIPKPQDKKELIRLRKKYEIVFKNTTFILAISEFTKNELIKLGCRKHKILVHHMGINTKVFKPSKSKIPLDLFNFIMIGRFVEKKGFVYGIRAFYKVLKNYPNPHLRLLIIGDGILHDALHKEVKYLRLEKHVNFLGKVPQKKVIKILQSGDCLICPSITTHEGKREGLPIVVMEAAACSLPIIATNHAAIPEILKNDRGILVKERSVRYLSNAMVRVLRNYRRLRKKLGKKARQLTIQEYDVEKLVKRLLDIFGLAKNIQKQELVLKKFSQNIQKYLPNEIFSILLTGSIARYEVITKESDIDLVVVCKNQNFIEPKALLKLNKAINLLKKNSGLQITPQIFTKFDLLQLLSPVLMKNYVEDGEIIYGENLINFFQKKLFHLSDFKYSIAILKRCLFERYFFRQYIVNSPQKQNYAFYNKLAKLVLFLARDFLYLSKNIMITKRKEIAEVFYAQYKNIIPLEAYKIINGEKSSLDSSTRKLFITQAIDFVEHTCDKIIKFIKKKYPNKKIYVSSF
jgi:colanic acid/amylovoran biosynthesis glycosyltransferase